MGKRCLIPRVLRGARTSISFFPLSFFFRLAHRSERTSPKRRDSPVVYLFNTSNHPYIWAVKGNLVQEQRSKTYNNPQKQRTKEQAKNGKNKTKIKPRNKIPKTNKETNKLNRLSSCTHASFTSHYSKYLSFTTLQHESESRNHFDYYLTIAFYFSNIPFSVISYPNSSFKLGRSRISSNLIHEISQKTIVHILALSSNV